MTYDPIITDQQLDDMRICNLPEVAALQVRCIDHMEDPKYAAKADPFTHSCPHGCTSPNHGWILWTDGLYDFAKPCPIHFKSFIQPEYRAKPATDAGIRAKKKEEAQAWMDAS